MNVLLVHHDVFSHHESQRWHPERPERLQAVLAGLAAADPEIHPVEAEPVNREALLRVHSEAYVDSIEAYCRAGGGYLDADTYANEYSWDAAMRSAGAGMQAVTALRAGGAGMAFLAIRPPGHHAISQQSMGFCLFNNIAITAQNLVDAGERVAIVDFDVHHGNGTQDSFEHEPAVLYVSLHEFPFYPGSGWLEETGSGPGSGFTLNVPFPASTAGDAYQSAFTRLIEPVVRQFKPDWVLVSAGYDAHAKDPLANMLLVESDYGFMGSRIAAMAPAGRVVFFLEGGYDLGAIEGSVAATVNGVAGRPITESVGHTSPAASWRAIDLAQSATSIFWEIG